MARADAWTHEEMILVLNLYLKLPFGKMDRRKSPHSQKGVGFFVSLQLKKQRMI